MPHPPFYRTGGCTPRCAAVVFLSLLVGCATSPPPPETVAEAPASPRAERAAFTHPPPPPATPPPSGIRQLIYDGKRSGEGYFSADGSQLIFQSERNPQNPFYEIYLLDLTTGDSQRVGPDYGKATCSWVHPSGESVLYASTMDDPDARAEMQAELDFRASGQSRRYSWDYDEYYDIYADPIGDAPPVNLTKTLGYDAEGSYSPDGKHIAFASNRRAYDGSMSDEEKAAFDGDPAALMDIYIMDADGRNVRRLTQTLGYDGGPFFSPDGGRITWRRFSPDGHTAEIWTMAIDGSDKKQLTELGAMSWAPYYHPSGDYLIFATNLHGFHNFELYLVDARGEKEPVRVTTTEGWDGLPVFSPDGSQLAWSSGRTSDKKAQIFIAQWNDMTARALLGMSPKKGEARYDVAPAADVHADLGATTADITAADARLIVEALSADAMDGRLTGTPGEAAATQWVAKAFSELGLEPAGSDGFYQPFTFTSGVSLEGPNVLSVTDAEGTKTRPELNSQWRPLAFSKAGSVGFAELVFAGYGIVAPKQGDQASYDSFGELDLTGKWAVVLRFMPEDIDAERRQHLARYAALRFKAMEARDRGAVGLIVVTGPQAEVRSELVPLRFDASVAGSSITAVTVSNELAQGWFTAAGKDLGETQRALDGGDATLGFDLPGTTVGGHLSLSFTESTGRNVLGRLQVGEAPSDEVIVVGAHVDHLGHGEGGDSLAKGDEVGQIHYGADDNASGIAGLVEIAQHLSAKSANGGFDGAKRDIVFAAWSGEELGLLGSNHFVKAWPQKGDDGMLTSSIAAYLNMDMIGRLNKQVTLQGVGSSPYWKGQIERRNVPVGLPIALSDDTFLPTDATSFYLKGVPILAAFTGAHSEYHTPRDTADLLDYDALAKIARLMGMLTADLSRADAAPEYVKKAPKGVGGNRRTGRAYLGTIPDYAESAIQGVMISGVSEGGPAAKAGLKGGDVLVELAGRPIENIYDYTRIIDGLKVGQPVKLGLMRGDERVDVEIIPMSRE